MMNYIWGFMLLIGILFALANNSAAGFTDGLMSSCTDAVEFIISLAGVMAVWSGLMKIAERSGLITVISRAISPLMAYLFPRGKEQPHNINDDNEFHGQHLWSRKQRNCILPKSHGDDG